MSAATTSNGSNPTPGLCDHMVTGPWPFATDFVIDAYMGIADCVVHCQRCNSRYLLGLVDWAPPTLAERLFTVDVIADDAWQRFAHDMSRDYCDLQRKAAEVHALRMTATPAGCVALDITAETVTATGARLDGMPTGGWRQRLLESSEAPGIWLRMLAGRN